MAIQNRRATLVACFVSIIFLAFLNLAATGRNRQAPAQKSEVERGKYLVEEVAKCPECHTPRDARGNLDTEAWLQGAPIWIRPVKPIPNWADRAPDLSGLPSFTDAEMERVLEKGIGPEGETLRPPMHIYHMNPSDAKAIIAYLKSLPATKH
jgi:mono/diheme cytochrome c family protein